jgi:hypothetical protein
MDSSDKGPDGSPRALEPENLPNTADGDGSPLPSVQAGEAVLAGGAVGPAMAQAAGADDDGLLGALTAMSLDHAFIDHALDQLTSSAELFDVPSLHVDASGDFFSPDSGGAES